MAEDGRVLFEDVHLSFSDSIFVHLSGPSGCGKTTLLQMVAGLRHAKDARRELAGREFMDDSMPEWRSRVLLMMQDAPVMAGDVERNLRFPFDMVHAAGRRFDRERAMSMMQGAGLGHLAMDHEARQLSGGERHRLALVRALLWSPDVILADEPLSGLDPANAGQCLEMLHEFAHAAGKMVLCVMHDKGYENFADLSLALRNGRLYSP